MTDPNATDAAAVTGHDQVAAPGAVSRRALLRGATLAVPAVLTLNSNTAVGWAIASGSIATRAPSGGSGSAICLDKTTVDREVTKGVYAFSNPEYVDVVNVPNSLYYRKREANWTGTKTPLRPEEVCTRGGFIEYSTTGSPGSNSWTKLKASVDPARYPLVSSTAVASFGSSILARNITEL